MAPFLAAASPCCYNSDANIRPVANPNSDVDKDLPCGLVSDSCNVCFFVVLYHIYCHLSCCSTSQQCSFEICIVIINLVYQKGDEHWRYRFCSLYNTGSYKIVNLIFTICLVNMSHFTALGGILSACLMLGDHIYCI